MTWLYYLIGIPLSLFIVTALCQMFFNKKDAEWKDYFAMNSLKDKKTKRLREL